MRSLFRFLRDRRFSYESLVTVEISRERLLGNLDAFADALSPSRIAPVLKANAYGHGLLEIAHIIDGHSHVSFLVVDSYFEALQLRNEHVRSPILVIGHTLSRNIQRNNMRGIAFTVGSLSQLRDLAHMHVAVGVHLKFDTGMHRQGIMPDELEDAVHIAQKNPNLRIEGVCSHLADADGADTEMTEKQIAVWNDIVKRWRAAVPQTKHYHLSATAGVRFTKNIDANTGRLGVGLYGVADVIPGLLPVLSMKTSITGVRTIQEGERVGYNGTWKAQSTTRVATIPVGYYEGVDRRLSNKGFVQVRGIICPIIGRVSMNMTTVNVTDVPDVAEGDDVTVIGQDPAKGNAVAHIAKICDTIPYEILVHLPTTLRRVVI
ncbi:MAG: hypothetical protein AMXMBFR44_1380 [Candidatus Campbellbacteria bacterium]